MTIRNFQFLLQPRSVALIGASVRPGSVGLITARNLLAGGFAGPIWLVNPKHSSIEGHDCYPSVAALPAAPDLAVIVTPPATLPCAHCRARGQGDTRRGRDHGGHSRRAEAGDARGGAPASAAHPGPELPRPDAARHRSQRRLLASAAACRRPRVRLPVGRPDHGDHRLGARPQHRLLPRRLAGRHGGRRLRRFPGLSRHRRGEPRHPALHGSPSPTRRSSCRPHAAPRGRSRSSS